jgi:hypothetical protein
MIRLDPNYAKLEKIPKIKEGYLFFFLCGKIIECSFLGNSNEKKNVERNQPLK